MTNKRSPRWAFMSIFDIHDPVTGILYLRRWRLFECPWFGIYVHRILRPDADRHLHDHPWPFVSFLLRGSYVELVPGCVDLGLVEPASVRDVRWLNVKRATDAHRIVDLPKHEAWTLILRGPRWREWGFYGDDGWVDWKTYLGIEDGTEV